MPCDTVQQNKIEFLETSTDTELLKKALEALGYSVQDYGNSMVFRKGYLNGTYFKANGQLNLPEQWDGNEIKRAYSEQVVNQQAAKFGWKISWSKNKEGNREAQVMKK